MRETKAASALRFLARFMVMPTQNKMPRLLMTVPTPPLMKVPIM